MQPQRPTSVLVLAIFHFILGGLGILLALIAVGGTAFVYAIPKTPAPAAVGPAFSATAQYQYLDAHLPYWKEADIVFGFLYLAISVLMIVAGVGLVQMRPWGRMLSLVYGGLSIVSQMIRLVYYFAFFLPVMMGFYDALMASAPGGGPPPAVVAGMKIGLVVGMCFALLGFIYPFIVLVLLLRPSTAAAFRGESMAPDDYGDRPDRGRRDDDYGQYPPGYGGEPDDRIGPAPR